MRYIICYKDFDGEGELQKKISVKQASSNDKALSKLNRELGKILDKIDREDKRPGFIYSNYVYNPEDEND